MSERAEHAGAEVLHQIPDVTLTGAVAPKGSVGKLAWLPVSSLAVDDRYQRQFRAENVARVREIAEGFNWVLFTPIVVANHKGRYVVIDGQHRSAAAKAVGASEVPAWVVDADLTAQSRIFIALNASTTKVPSMQLWHSRLAARDPDALALFEVCGRAGVKVSRYPIAQINRRPDVTLCPDMISKLRQAYGDGALVSALVLLRHTGEIKQESLLVGRYIRPVHRIFQAGQWSQQHLEPLAETLASLDFSGAMLRAQSDAKVNGGSYVDFLVKFFLRQTPKHLVTR